MTPFNAMRKVIVHQSFSLGILNTEIRFRTKGYFARRFSEFSFIMLRTLGKVGNDSVSCKCWFNCWKVFAAGTHFVDFFLHIIFGFIMHFHWLRHTRNAHWPSQHWCTLYLNNFYFTSDTRKIFANLDIIKNLQINFDVIVQSTVENSTKICCLLNKRNKGIILDTTIFTVRNNSTRTIRFQIWKLVVM